LFHSEVASSDISGGIMRHTVQIAGVFVATRFELSFELTGGD